MNQALCILAAGRGGRLGELTASINKALLPVDNKAAISHIIGKAPIECEVVVAVGYDKEKVREYCEAAHPERTFIFVEVDKLEGPGSGPGYSLLCCEPHLQRPFYLCNADTLIAEDDYLPLDQNWIGCAPTQQPETFATVDTAMDHHLSWRVSRFYDKGPEGGSEAFIGLLGIKDFRIFWESLTTEIQLQPEQQYVAAFTADCLARLRPLAVQYDWFDTGSVEGYHRTCEWFEGGEILGLPKNINEITYKVNGRLIKLCLDSGKNLLRLQKAKSLGDLVPQIVFKGKYVTAYTWEDGDTLYHSRYNLQDWFECFDWCRRELWMPQVRPKGWERICHDFYYHKTLDRIRSYYRSRSIQVGCYLRINGQYCCPPEQVLTDLDWAVLDDGTPTRIHGDLQFDNIVYAYSGKFRLIDWRECFGPLLDCGDIYYDIAKLYSGLGVPYDLLKKGEFDLSVDGDNVSYSFQIDVRRQLFKDELEETLNSLGYDLYKVKTLAALVYLNMAPLHPGDLGDLLYYHGMFRLDAMERWQP